jgi:hypothetical protein
MGRLVISTYYVVLLTALTYKPGHACEFDRQMPRSRGHKGSGAGFRTGLSTFETQLLRRGTTSRREREILLLRAARKRPGAHEDAGPSLAPPATAAAPPDVPAAAEDTLEARLAEALARGLGGYGIDEDQMLRRLMRAREADATARAKAAENAVTPAAASLLSELRTQLASSSQVLVSGQLAQGQPASAEHSNP